MTDKEKILLKQFRPVTIRDDMMFGTVMAEPEYCKPFWETILEVKIKKIEYPEMQTGRNRDLPKRARYYHYPNHYKIQTFLESI